VCCTCLTPNLSPVSTGHFKCNKYRIADKPALLNFVREVYQLPGVAATVHMDHIKHHYYESHRFINPSGVVPIGEGADLTVPHGREALGGHAAADDVPRSER